MCTVSTSPTISFLAPGYTFGLCMCRGHTGGRSNTRFLYCCNGGYTAVLLLPLLLLYPAGICSTMFRVVTNVYSYTEGTEVMLSARMYALPVFRPIPAPRSKHSTPKKRMQLLAVGTTAVICDTAGCTRTRKKHTHRKPVSEHPTTTEQIQDDTKYSFTRTRYRQN